MNSSDVGKQIRNKHTDLVATIIDTDHTTGAYRIAFVLTKNQIMISREEFIENWVFNIVPERAVPRFNKADNPTYTPIMAQTEVKIGFNLACDMIYMRASFHLGQTHPVMLLIQELKNQS